MLIGIDFDNTIAGYDALFADAARRLFGPVTMVSPESTASTKTAIRDALRAESGGESRWRELQAEVYGRRMAEAEPMPGVEAFLRAANDRGLPMRIISHKSRHAAADPGGMDLRKAAMCWLGERGLLDAKRTGLGPDNVFFEDTRVAKIERVASVGCTHFIDDLREVLTDPAFPKGVRRYLFGATGNTVGLERFKRTPVRWKPLPAHVMPRDMVDAIQTFSNWREIADDILDRCPA